MGLFSFLNKEIAIDLGTANTLIIYKDQVVVDEPSIVAIDKKTNQVIAVGKKAMLMHEKRRPGPWLRRKSDATPVGGAR